MTVYRIENPLTGHGPYYGSMGDWCDCPHNYTTGRPMPEEDVEPQAFQNFRSITHYTDIRHGFSSMDKLMAWFSPTERQKLADLGFYVYVYDLPSDAVAEGQYQVLFALSKIYSKSVQASLYSLDQAA